MSFNPYDADQVRARASRRKARADPASLDLAWVTGDPRGRRVLLRLLDICGVFAPSHTPGDPLGTAFREGQRNIGLQLHAALTHVGYNTLHDILKEPISSDERNA